MPDELYKIVYEPNKAETDRFDLTMRDACSLLYPHDLRPIVQVIQEHILPLRQEIEWGPSLPYNLTGQMNQHPRAAIEWREGDTPDDFLAFYAKVVTDV